MHPWSDSLCAPAKPALFALAFSAAVACAPVFAQSSTASAPVSVPEPVAQHRAAQRSNAVDLQLPAYLQDDPQADAGSLVPDPWERYNRHVYRFNKKVDQRIVKPVALAYQRHVPKPVRAGVTNFFTNLQQPVNAANLLLQGHPDKSAESLGRFAVDTTLGIGGLFDPATAMHFPQFNEDFGQTLGRWGWRRSRYFLIPFLGPGMLRDRVGKLVDGQISWNHFVSSDQTRLGLLGVSLVDMRTQLLPLDKLSQGLDDDYVLVREAWGQRRNYQIDDQTVRSAADAAATDEREIQAYDLPAK